MDGERSRTASSRKLRQTAAAPLGPFLGLEDFTNFRTYNCKQCEVAIMEAEETEERRDR